MGRHLGAECSICQVLNNSTTCVEKSTVPKTKGETGKFLASRAKNGKNIAQRPGHTRQAGNGYAFPPRIS